MEAQNTQGQQVVDPWFLKSSFPVFLPEHPALTASSEEFDAHIRQHAKPRTNTDADVATDSPEKDGSDTDTIVFTEATTETGADTQESMANKEVESCESEGGNGDDAAPPANAHPFMQGLLSYEPGQDGEEEDTLSVENKMLTENGDVAHRCTTNYLVDLFYELEEVVSGPRLRELLTQAWNEDSTATLKIIFNSRSIHLGKASRQTFYRCAGWLVQNHPQTLIANLAWLSRPVIAKKAGKEGENDDIVIVEEELDENDPARFDVKHGVAHGYWKDLLSMLALYANAKLDVLADPREVLNIAAEKDKKKWPKSTEEAKSLRHGKRDDRHEHAVQLYNEDPTYRTLHIAVARLFAHQLQTDLALLTSKDATTAAKKNTISLCAKWAPSSERFADKHTFVVSSIAELMHPLSEFAGFAQHDPASVEQRSFYLRHARDAYRKDVAALRKQLAVVERAITAGAYAGIQYARVPSLAMHNYAPLFAAKDPERFEQYIDKVAHGKARISGATLLPSTLIHAARRGGVAGLTYEGRVAGKRKAKGTKGLVEAKIQQMAGKAVDGQWRTLVQRVKDSGTLENCIAIADVSGSMGGPVFADGTTPMDSSIGLSLLVAEVCKPPFGGAFITFSTDPTVQRIDLSKTLREKVDCLERAEWTMGTDFVAVFEKLLLPMAIEHNLKQEDMVKRVFVFSDMQFDAAEESCYTYDYHGAGSPRPQTWSTSYERIEKKFHDAGYEMPELVFWNLAGGRAGYGAGGGGDPVAPKPVTADEPGTALVSGYSQGMLKMFMENGSFEDMNEEMEEDIVETVDEDGAVVLEKVVKKQKLDPLSVVKKAIGHKAYDMLRVVD